MCMAGYQACHKGTLLAALENTGCSKCMLKKSHAIQTGIEFVLSPAPIFGGLGHCYGFCFKASFVDNFLVKVDPICLVGSADGRITSTVAGSLTNRYFHHTTFAEIGVESTLLGESNICQCGAFHALLSCERRHSYNRWCDWIGSCRHSMFENGGETTQ